MIKITQTTMTISEWGQVADNPILRKELAGGGDRENNLRQ